MRVFPLPMPDVQSATFAHSGRAGCFGGQGPPDLGLGFAIDAGSGERRQLGEVSEARVNQSVTIARLSTEIAKAAEIRKALQESDDPKLVLDMIEGETDLNEAVAVIYEETLSDIALAAGLEAMVKTLNERHSRIMKGIETKRSMILMAMDRTGVPTIRTPLATITVRDVAPSATITDEAQIPAQFWKPQEPKLDKKAVTEALKGGATVPGAELSNGGITLSIRTK